MRALSVAAIGAVAFLVPLAVALPASAHSSLVSTDPAADGPDGNSVIESLPDHVSLTFSDDLTPPLPAEQQQGGESTTQIRVYDETCTDAALLIADPGHADTRDCTDYADGEAAVDGPTVSVAVNNVGAPAGVYTVVWQVVYGDGHADSQMFTFTAESAVAAEQSPSATPSATESPESPTEPPAETPAQTETPGASTDDAANSDAADEGTETPGIIEDNSPLSTPAVVAIVGGALVLVLVVFIIVMIARARRQ
jgi:methionine-rich copper-binding protein CopC